MITKKLKSGFEIPVLGIGTYGMGGDHTPDYSQDAQDIASIKQALDLGFTHIDTAEAYGGGHTEELVGEAIKSYTREELFITTKVFKTHLHYDAVIASLHDSLKRLNTNYVNLYLIHASNPEIPIKETMLALNELVSQGLVKYIGVCNFTIEQLKEAQAYSKFKIVTNQMKHSLWTKNSPDLETMKYCQKNDIIITAYKILGRGDIDKVSFPLLDELSKKYGQTKHQIMINWVCSKENFIGLFKSSNVVHLKENIAALDFKISSDDIKRLNKLVETHWNE